MLQLTLPTLEFFDERLQEFIRMEEQTLMLEHSLMSLSKWECRWNKAFLSRKDKTDEELIDYVRCMTISENVDPKAYEMLTREHIEQINDYIAAPMTAVYFPEGEATFERGDTVTSELIYYWMTILNIPFECEKWHLNRLFSFIKVCSIKNSSNKKMSRGEIMRRNASLNAARRKKYNTRG